MVNLTDLSELVCDKIAANPYNILVSIRKLRPLFRTYYFLSKNCHNTLILWKKPHIFHCCYQFLSLNMHIYDFYHVTGTPKVVQCTIPTTVCGDTNEVGYCWTLRYIDGSFGGRILEDL